jgi:hypothetical protein
MLLVTLLVVGATALIGKSLVATIIRDTKVIQKKSAAEAQLKENILAAPQLISEYEQLGSKKVLLEDALPESIDFPSLIVTVENMSKIAGMKLKTVTSSVVATTGASGVPVAQDGSVAPVPQTYNFGISFTGSYDGLNRLLKEIEVSARPMRVLDIQLTGGGNSLTGLIDVETYYQDKAQLPFSKETVK